MPSTLHDKIDTMTAIRGKTRNHALMRRKHKGKAPLGFIVDSGMRTNSMVYFIRWRATGFPLLIKVGHTSRGKGIAGRLKEHRVELARSGHSLDYRMDIFALVAGGVTEETVVHDYFSRYQWNGQREIFYPATELLDYIRWLRDCFFVECGDDESDPHRHWPPVDIEAVTGDQWLPDTTTTKPAPESPPIDQQMIFPFDKDIAQTQPLFGPRTITGDDYYTPPIIMDVVKKFWPDGIDLDPASHPVANRVVGARRIYRQEDNGLLQRWYGRVWLNPPFGQWKMFAGKVLSSLPDITELLTLTGVPTITAQYYQELFSRASAWCFISGRPVFLGPYSSSSSPAGFFISYYGPRADDFCQCFRVLGVMGVPVR